MTNSIVFEQIQHDVRMELNSTCFHLILVLFKLMVLSQLLEILGVVVRYIYFTVAV